MKNKSSKIWQVIRIYISFPQTWMFFGILILTIIVLFLSMVVKNDYWQSLLSNIVAGLFTGLVIYWLGGLRQIYFTVQKQKLNWMLELRKLIRDYSRMHSQFLEDDYNETVREYFVGEMCGNLVCIGDAALQSSSDKRIHFDSEEYCRKHFDFDPVVFYRKSNNILESFCDNTYPEKEDVVELLKDIDEEVHDLNHKIYMDMKSLKVKLAIAQRSFL